MFRLGAPAQPTEVNTHETDTLLGLSLGSDDYVHNMVAQNNMGRNTCI